MSRSPKASFQVGSMVLIKKAMDTQRIGIIATVISVYLSPQEVDYEVEFPDGYVHVFRDEHLIYPDKMSILLYAN